MCSGYDNQEDVLKYPPDEHSPFERWEKYCAKLYDLDVDECNAYKGAMDKRKYRVCMDNAQQREWACLKTAGEITGGK